MPYVIVGLGNPGDEYNDTRHNAGRMAVELFGEKNDITEWKSDKVLKAQIAKGKIDGDSVVLVLPDTFMNNSGKSVVPLIQSKKAAEKLIVIHDEIDLPMGTIRVVFGRSSGGHRGVESIIRTIKTQDFVRIRIGVAPATAKGVAKKPKGEEAVVKFLLGKFKSAEMPELKKILKTAAEAVATIITEGHLRAMNEYNGR